MSGAVVLHSGGQDSTTCLAWAIETFGRDNIYPVSFFYDQRHQVELECANAICRHFEVREPFTVAVEALVQFGSAALTNPEIDVSADATNTGNVFAEAHDLPSTFVPGRNMLFFTLALAYGAKFGIYNLVTGVCEADAAGYPDCRREFVNSAVETLRLALDEDEVMVHAPLLALDKARTFALAESLGVLETVVEMSHTCYQGDRNRRHAWGYGCGECPACQERASGWNKFVTLDPA